MAGTLQSISVGPGNSFSLRRPTYADSIYLSTTPYFWKVPSTDIAHVLMSAAVNFSAFYLASSVGTSVGSTAVIMNSTAPTTDGGGSELNPTMREIKGVAYIGFIGASSGQGSISAWLP